MSSRGEMECVINPAVSVTCAAFMHDSQNSKPCPHKEQKLLSEAGAGVLIEHDTVHAYRSSASRILWWKSFCVCGRFSRIEEHGRFGEDVDLSFPYIDPGISSKVWREHTRNYPTTIGAGHIGVLLILLLCCIWRMTS
jgi:hypothetical protein